MLTFNEAATAAKNANSDDVGYKIIFNYQGIESQPIEIEIEYNLWDFDESLDRVSPNLETLIFALKKNNSPKKYWQMLQEHEPEQKHIKNALRQLNSPTRKTALERIDIANLVFQMMLVAKNNNVTLILEEAEKAAIWCALYEYGFNKSKFKGFRYTSDIKKNIKTGYDYIYGLALIEDLTFN